MVICKEWNEFETEIITQNRKFFIYGAGIVYKKIIHAVDSQVIAILDINAENIKNENPNIPIIRPEKILDYDVDNVFLLCCLNPFRDYIQRTEQVKKFFEHFEKNVIIYYLDNQKINEKGLIIWGKKELLIDNLLYLVNEGWKRKHMRLAYADIVDYDHDYIKKLYDEPVDFNIYGKRIGLKNYNNGLIVHKNGKKETTPCRDFGEEKSCIWIFGDSRVSGMLNSNDCTFPSFLQMKIDNCAELKSRVINCGIPGRDIERMVYQIKTEDIHEGDIVILGTGFYEYEGDVLKNVLLWCRYIKEAFDECKRKNADFMYINFPTLLEMDSRSPIENEMLELFNTTEFTEYKIEEMIYCKNVIYHVCNQNGILFYDFAEAFKNREQYGHVFINLHHYGPKGNRLIADAIYKILLTQREIREVRDEEIERRKNERDNSFNNKIKHMREEECELQDYLNGIKTKLLNRKVERKCIGSIVMNANPFTFGHLFLAEEALKIVDFLIVFVVSEDASEFSFNERFEMVYSNLAYNNRILVVPSGKYCISKSTFPDYFKKEDLQDQEVTAVNDLKVFADKIARELQIKIRFVGEEPEDTVTRQYNIEMKKILPEFGIKVVEIPRKALDDKTVISGSIVRKYYKELNWEKMEPFVPKKTIQLLKKYASLKR